MPHHLNSLHGFVIGPIQVSGWLVEVTVKSHGENFINKMYNTLLVQD